jgi:hypothetical protein
MYYFYSLFPLKLLECALTLACDLAYIWPRCPHQYYLCATPPSKINALLVFKPIYLSALVESLGPLPIRKDSVVE